jgi:hypothetical protein
MLTPQRVLQFELMPEQLAHLNLSQQAQQPFLLALFSLAQVLLLQLL